MGRVITACVAVLLGTLVFGSTAGAITYGSPDGGGHPEVGALLAPVAYSDGTWETCSGTLISATVFLTAAHCDQGVSRVAVTFDSSYNSVTGKTYWGTWRADPKFRGAQSDPYDIAVVMLDKNFGGWLPAAVVREEIRTNLLRNGWSTECVEVVVIDPELEIWLWQRGNPHVAREFRYNGSVSLEEFLEAEGL